MDSEFIKVSGLTKSYGAKDSGIVRVLKGIDLDISEGEVVAIVGQSGAGKSTLLHILGTLDRPDSGEYFFRGQKLLELNDKKLSEFRNRQIGFIFQFHHLLPEFTAIENVLIPAMIGGTDNISEAKKMLDEVGLSQRIEHKPSELSGGESQRVAIARALINSPSLILADEPTGNLDTENSEAVIELIFRLRERLGKTFVIVTHNTQFASRCDRIVNLKDGEVTGIVPSSVNKIVND